MAKIYITCTADETEKPFTRRDFKRLIRYAEIDKVKQHCITKDITEADLIVFVGYSKVNYWDVRKSELYKKNKHKSVIFDSSDKGIPFIPGIYSCLEKRLAIFYSPAFLSGFYLRVTDNSSLDIEDLKENAKYLFSFVGNVSNHRVREKILQISYERSYVRDSSSDSRQQDDGIGGENKERGILYQQVLIESKFVLCPRGKGVSSWRLFETMRAGRVPVVISDEWIPPEGPKWDSFAIFVKENDINMIPNILENLENKAIELGKNARQEWEAWYAEDVVFNTVTNMLLVAHFNRDVGNIFLNIFRYIQYLSPHYFRHWVLSPIKTSMFSLVRRLLQNK